MDIVAIDLSGYDKLIDQLAADLHSSKLKASDLNQQLITKTYDNLYEGAGKGYGKDWVKFPADGKGSLPLELKKNLYAFSGAKTYANLEAINQLLYDKDGKLRPFNEFAVLAKKINRQYNENYLQAEYQTARTAAQMAEKWERIVENADIFPNLKFRTVGDDRVRPEHEKLNGIIRPINDPFWSKYYPPLDWRCRCDAVSTGEDENEFDEEDFPPVQFKGNVGKDQEIFTKKGTFFKLAAGNENARRNMELSKLNAPYETVHKAKNGKKVEVNLFADPKDLETNVTSAIIITEALKTNVQIRPHLDTNIAKGQKNGEYLINGNVSDLKSQFKDDNYKGMHNAFDSARKQGLESIVFDFTKSFKELDLFQINRQVLSNINEKRGKQFKELIFVYGKKAVKVDRETIVKKQLMPILEKLKADS